MIPSDDPGYGSLGQAFPSWTGSSAGAILQPPMLEIRPSARVLERVVDRDADMEAEDLRQPGASWQGRGDSDGSHRHHRHEAHRRRADDLGPGPPIQENARSPAVIRAGGCGLLGPFNMQYGPVWRVTVFCRMSLRGVRRSPCSWCLSGGRAEAAAVNLRQQGGGAGAGRAVRGRPPAAGPVPGPPGRPVAAGSSLRRA